MLPISRLFVRPCLVLILILNLLATLAHAQSRCVISPARPIPIIDRVDLVVVGGSDGAIAAACIAARRGARVMLLNENTFLSSEVTAKGRFLLAGPAPATDLTRQLFADMTPAQYRLAADTVLRQAGVMRLDNTRPAGVLLDSAGKLAGVLTANKAGVQAVVAKVVLDATYTGAVTDAAGAERTPWNVKTLTVSRAHYAKGATSLKETVKTVPMPELSWPLINQAEAQLREKSLGMVGNAFAYNMDFIVPNPILGQVTDPSPAFAGAVALDLGVCQPRSTERLLVLGSACAVSRQAAKDLMQPVALAMVGERLGERAAQMAAALPMPTEVRVKAPAEAGAPVPDLAISELAGRERPFKRAPLETVSQPPVAIPVWADYDVIVVGSGPAGHSAAIAAGRAGAKTLLIEQGGYIGGNVALGITSFWCGYRGGFNQEWTNRKYPIMVRDAGVDIWYNSLAMGAVKCGNRLAGVEVATWMGRGVALGKIIIDASGDGDVCAAAGAQYTYLNDGDLYLKEASYMEINLYYYTLPLDPIDVVGSTFYHTLAAQAGKLTWDYKPMAQMRETRLIKGDLVINELDLDANRTYHDAIAVSLSAYDPHTYFGSDYSYAGLRPPGRPGKTSPGSVTSYIPLRAIIPAGLENTMMAGRCHSTTHDAQSVLRMNADLINEGYAAGYAAALCVKEGTTPRTVNLNKLQDHLFEIKNLPAADRERILKDLPDPTDQAIAAASANPSGREHLLTLARGGERSLVPLRKSFVDEATTTKALALCLLGAREGVPALADWLDKQPASTGPGYNLGSFGKNPEIIGAEALLGVPRDPRAVPALVRKLKECRPGLDFSEIRAISRALGRIGDPSAARPLYDYLEQPGVQGHMNPGDDPSTITGAKFGPALMELFAASALYRCGDCNGLGRKILTAYLDDWRGVFVRYAGNVLAEKNAGGGGSGS